MNMVANKLSKKAVLILLFMISAAFTFAQKVGDRDYKLLSINGEKVYRWMECIDIDGYYENGVNKAKSSPDHLGLRNWEVTKPEDCCVDYISTEEIENEYDEIKFFYTSLKRFQNGKLVYEENDYGEGDVYTRIYNYNTNDKTIKIHDEGYQVDDYYEYDAKGNLIYRSEFNPYFVAWYEYDKQGKRFRYFTEESGWQNVTEDFKDWDRTKLLLKSIKIESIPESYWQGNITYWINNNSSTAYKDSNGMQFEINQKGQIVTYKTNYEVKYRRQGEFNLIENYEYDSEGRLTGYKFSQGKNNPSSSIEEHYYYNKKGNKVRYTTIYYGSDWDGDEKRLIEKSKEEGTFNTKGNKSHFTYSDGDEGYYFYEYYPSGAVKTRRKYKYLSLGKEE